MCTPLWSVQQSRGARSSSGAHWPTAYRASAGCEPHRSPRRSLLARLLAHLLYSSSNLWHHPARSPLRCSHLVPLFSPSPQSSFQPLHWVRTEMSPNRSPLLLGSVGSSSNTPWMGGKEEKPWILIFKHSHLMSGNSVKIFLFNAIILKCGLF